MEGDYNRNEIYRECLRNHAASLGSYATDGCGEFTLDDTSPGGLQCAACGCHRNFHRKVTTYAAPHAAACSTRGTAGEMIEYGSGSGGGGGGSGGRHHHHMMMLESQSPRDSFEQRSDGGGVCGNKKRFRTKFTPEQKEKMLGFAEKLGWKLQRKDQEDEIEKFCRSVGVSRQVFKVWMHNHKNSSSSSSASTGNASSLTT